MSLDTRPEIRCTAEGGVGDELADIARAHIERVVARLDVPAREAVVRLAHARGPARERPYIAEVTLQFDDATIRAHVAATTMAEALDLLDQRLSRRVERFVARRDQRRRGGPAEHDADDHTWRHGDLPTQRPAHFPRPAYERGLVRHKTFAAGAMTADEAADVLDQLGHDFLLFANLATGADAVVWFDADGLALADSSGSAEALGANTVTPMTLRNEVVRRCTQAQALQELDLDLEPFVFFVDPDVHRGQVAYNRYDGHYGLIGLS